MPLLDTPPTLIEPDVEIIPVPLIGTKRQVAWAETIRARILPEVRQYILEAERLLLLMDAAHQRDPSTCAPFNLAYAKRGIEVVRLAEAELLRRNNARWWVANARANAAQFLQRAAQSIEGYTAYRIDPDGPASLFDPELGRRIGGIVDYEKSEAKP